MCELLLNQNKLSYQAAKKKYSLPKFLEISNINILYSNENDQINSL